MRVRTALDRSSWNCSSPTSPVLSEPAPHTGGRVFCWDHSGALLSVAVRHHINHRPCYGRRSHFLRDRLSYKEQDESRIDFPDRSVSLGRADSLADRKSSRRAYPNLTNVRLGPHHLW